jgi:hypothetical protein
VCGKELIFNIRLDTKECIGNIDEHDFTLWLHPRDTNDIDYNLTCGGYEMASNSKYTSTTLFKRNEELMKINIFVPINDSVAFIKRLINLVAFN